MVQRRLTNGSVAQSARGGTGPGSIRAPSALVRGTGMLLHGSRILRTVARALDGLRSSSRLGYGTRTTYPTEV